MKHAEIAQLLPGVFQRTLRPDNPLSALLALMEQLHEPDEFVLAYLDEFFQPYRAPNAFVAFLAGWVDLERLLVQSPEERARTQTQPLPSGTGRLRELVAAAAYLSKWRGTAKGLLRFLETATGAHGFQIDENVLDAEAQSRAYHIRIHAPAETQVYAVMLRRIIEFEKPAYVTYDLVFDQSSAEVSSHGATT